MLSITSVGLQTCAFPLLFFKKMVLTINSTKNGLVHKIDQNFISDQVIIRRRSGDLCQLGSGNGGL